MSEKFNVHMTVRKENAIGVGFAYTTQIDADDASDARYKAIQYVRKFHDLETLEIRDVSRPPNTSQPQ